MGVVRGRGHGAANGFRLPPEETESDRFRELESDRDGLVERENEGVLLPKRKTKLSPGPPPVRIVEVEDADVTDWGKVWNASEVFRSGLLYGSGFLKSIRIGTAASPGDER